MRQLDQRINNNKTLNVLCDDEVEIHVSLVYLVNIVIESEQKLLSSMKLF